MYVCVFLNDPPPDLQIYAVTPVPESVNVLQMDRVPDRIKSFYRVNNVRRFRYDRPFHKGSKDRENEFKVGRPSGTFSPLTLFCPAERFSSSQDLGFPKVRIGV